MDFSLKSDATWRINVRIVLSYVILTILMTMPLITKLGNHIPAAEGSDVWIHEWTFWWIEKALLNLQNPFYTDLLFHPTGTSLFTHNIAWFNIGIWFPLQAALGDITAYSLTYILVFSLNSYCMYLLTYGWTHSRAAGFIAGLIYGFWPYTFTQSGHPNMATIMWPPLVLFYLRRIAQKSSNRRHNLIMAGLFIALTGIARYQLLLVASLLFGIYLIYLFVRQSSLEGTTSLMGLPTQFSVVGRLLLPFVLAGFLMFPLAGPVIYTQLTQDFPEEVLVYEPWFGTPLLTYLIPNSRLGIYRAVVEQLPEALQFHYQRVDFLGYTTLFLALVGVIWRWRQTALWLLVALLYWTLALGPTLTLAYEQLPNIPMPYRLVEDFPLIQIVRRPHRFNAFAALPLGLMAGYGITVLETVFKRRRNESRHRRSWSWSTVLAILCGLLILAEYRPSPYGLESTHIPDWYHQLAADPDDFAIFGLPPSPRLADKYFMHYQILHKKPMIEGHISRPTNATFGFMDQSDFLWHLRIHRVMQPELVAVSHQLQLLVDANVRYLILHKFLLTDEQLAQFVDWLTYEPIYEDGEVVVYHTDPKLERDYQIKEWLTEEIGLIAIGNGPKSLVQGELFKLDLRWGSRARPAQDYEACLTLRPQSSSSDNLVADQSCFDIGGEWPTSMWSAHEVARGTYTMRIDPLLEPNTYLLTLDVVSTGDDDSKERETVTQRPIGNVKIHERARVFTPPQIANQTSLLWDNRIGLHGFNLEQEDMLVRVQLIWHTRKRLDRSYKVFVHVVDEASGSIIAQNDSVPRQWSYPTTWWEANEYIEETIELSLTQSSRSDIQIFVGLYDEETGIRLPVTDAKGNQFDDDAAQLTPTEYP